MIQSTLKISAARLGTMVVSFAGIAYFSRELGAAGVGTFFLYQALTQVLVFATDLGLNDAITKRISEGYEPGRILSAGLLSKAFFMIIAVVGILLFHGQVNKYIGLDVALLLGTGILLAGYANTGLHILKAEMQMDWFAAFQLTDTILFTGISAVLVSVGYGPYGLIYGMLIGKALILSASVIRSETRPKPPHWNHLSSLYNFSKYSFVGKLVGRSLSWIDVLVIGAFLTQAHVGAYEIAWRISKLSVLLASAVSNIIFPKISELDASDLVKEIHDAISDGLILALILPIPALFGVAVLSEPILTLTFGPEFKLAASALIVLSIGRILNAVTKVIRPALQGLDKPAQVAKAGLISVVLNIVLNILLVGAFGLIGGATATTISFGIGAVLLYHFLTGEVPIQLEYKLIGWILFSSLLMAVIIIGVTVFVDIASLFNLIYVVALGGIIYTLILGSSRGIRDRVRSLV